MSLRGIRIGFSYARVFFKREFKDLTGHPLKPSPIKLILMGILILAVLVWGSNKYQTKLFHPILREGIIGLYQSSELPPTVTNLLSQGLLKVDQSGIPEPNLASSITSNDTGTKFTLTLKDNLYWADHTPIKSNDIQFSFQGVQVSYPDSKTIEFNLNEPYSPFPSLLTKPIFKVNSLLGIGPYFVSNQQDLSKGPYPVKRVVLSAINEQMPDLAIMMFPSENVAKLALRMGEIQSILGAGTTGDYQGQNNFKVYSQLNKTQLVAVFYNTKDPVLSDENLRLALSFGTPSVPGELEAKTTIPPTSWVFNSEVKDYLDNPTQAESYLKKVEKGKDQTITLTTTNSLRLIGEKVVEAWDKMGLHSRLVVESGIPQSFQALLIAQNIPVDPDQYALWHSTQIQTNITKVSNPRIDKDLEVGRKATDSAKRKTAYQDFQKTLLDHSPATPLYFPKINVVYNKKVETDLMKVLALQLGQ